MTTNIDTNQTGIRASHDIDQRTGAVIDSVPDPHNGPSIIKIRVLKECEFLEIYWDEYVDEAEAINPDNFTLTNGDTVVTLKAKPEQGVTDTLFFDRDNKEIGATSGNCMRNLDPNLHLSSIAYSGTIDPDQQLTLQVRGHAIADEKGRHAPDAIYRHIPVLSFYTKRMQSHAGIPVVADDTVADTTMHMAIEQIDTELGKPGTGIVEAMIESNNVFAIYGMHENVYMLPEQRCNFSKDMYDVEGLGGVPTRDGWIASISEKNILRILNSPNPEENTHYRNENILIHEFGHSILIGGIQQMHDLTLRNIYYRAYAHARSEGLWAHTYAIQDSDEFFATMATVWFNVCAEPRDGINDGVRGAVNVRSELKEYDPMTYDAMARIFPDSALPAPWDRPSPNEHGLELQLTEKPNIIARTCEHNDLGHDIFQITSDRFDDIGDLYYIHPGYTARGGGIILSALWGTYNSMDDTSSAWTITRNDNGTLSFATVPSGGWGGLGLTANEDGSVSIEGHAANRHDSAQQWRFRPDSHADNPYDGFLVSERYGKTLGTPAQPYECSLLTLNGEDSTTPGTMTWRLRNLTQSRKAADGKEMPDLYMPVIDRRR